jgi:hypothetical protein
MTTTAPVFKIVGFCPTEEFPTRCRILRYDGIQGGCEMWRDIPASHQDSREDAEEVISYLVAKRPLSDLFAARRKRASAARRAAKRALPNREG